MTAAAAFAALFVAYQLGALRAAGWPRKKVIMGCDARGDGKSPYLTRRYLYESRRFDSGGEPLWAVYLHRFHRSDADELHDHPWGFVTLLLWRGYFEVTPCAFCEGSGSWVPRLIMPARLVRCGECGGTGRLRRRKRPGMVLWRPATTIHRVELVKDRKGRERTAWSLVVRGSYVREWGFYTARGWELCREYFARNRC